VAASPDCGPFLEGGRNRVDPCRHVGMGQPSAGNQFCACSSA
jgi:hypothetical protein